MWQRSESTVSPQLLDFTSTPGMFYVRKNVTSEVRTDERGNKTKWYMYDEAYMNLAEYLKYAMELQQAAEEENANAIAEVGDAVSQNDTAATDNADAITELGDRVAEIEAKIGGTTNG